MAASDSAIFSNRVLTTIGGMCYSIYLFHFLVIYAVKHISMPVHFGNNFWRYYAVQSCAILPFVLVFCGGFFLVIERPCMDRLWPQKLWRVAEARIGQLQADRPVSRDDAAADLVGS